MIIILEGPDGAGKTTLAKSLEDRGWRTAYHDDPPEPGEDKFERYVRIVGSLDPSENVILDRFAPSEHVYSHVLRPDSVQITEKHLRLVNRLLYAKGALTIFCLPPWDVVEENWRARYAEELVKQPDQLRLIYQAYQTLWRSEYRELNAIDYDYTKKPDWAIFGVGSTRPLVAHTLPQGVIGHPSARFLILGEQSNEQLDLAFFSLKPSTSAHYLNNALWDAGFDEYDLCFTNALTYQGKERSIRNLYEGRVVIALGEIAQELCREQGVPYLPAYHPQFWKRFRASQRKDYVDKLRMYHGSQKDQ